MNNVMVDLETLGVSNNPVILSIGAVKFDGAGLGEEFYREIAVQSCEEAGLVKDQSTLDWWATQDPELYTKAIGGQQTLESVLLEFSAWLGEECNIWGNGACSDNIWLKSAYDACGLVKPWGHWNDRCYRTVLALFPETKKVLPKIPHHALSDAVAQALTLTRMLDWDEGAVQL